MNKSLNIYAFEAFYGGSHKSWLDELVQFSSHQITIFTLEDQTWKWRMHASAITFAEQIKTTSLTPPDLILVTDMMDVALFRSLLPQSWRTIPIALYFHENQFAYPKSSNDKIHNRSLYPFQFINYTSALTSEAVFFNSHYNKESFLEGAFKILNQARNHKNLDTIPTLKEKCEVLNLGIKLPAKKEYESSNIVTIVWNHRWEEDKNPREFFETLKRLKQQGLVFKLIILGTRMQKYPSCFDEAKNHFKEDLIHFGKAETKKEYYELLEKADLAYTTSMQDFFGISVLESIQMGCIPILPNRLAYPEHFPQNSHPSFFYNTAKQAVKILTRYIKSGPGQKDLENFKALQERIQTYHWEFIIKDYDKAFIEVFKKHLKGPS